MARTFCKGSLQLAIRSSKLSSRFPAPVCTRSAAELCPGDWELGPQDCASVPTLWRSGPLVPEQTSLELAKVEAGVRKVLLQVRERILATADALGQPRDLEGTLARLLQMGRPALIPEQGRRRRLPPPSDRERPEQKKPQADH